MQKRVWVLELLLFWSVCFAQDRPSVLIVNDDGIESAGIIALAEAFQAFAQVTVAAPMSNQSASGHSLTTRGPISVKTRQADDGTFWYAIDARPATCTRLALENLVAQRPDLVISGINRGENIGLATFLSGTVGAAREAVFVGIPAIAISHQVYEGMDYGPAARFAADLAKKYLEKGLPPGTFLNVNVPALPPGTIRGVQVTRLSLDRTINFFREATSELEGIRSFNPGYRETLGGEPGTDRQAILAGFISVTPLHLDQTKTSLIPEIQAWSLNTLLP